MDKNSSASKSKKAASPRPNFPGDSPGKPLDIISLDKDDLSRKKSSSSNSSRKSSSSDKDKDRRDSYYGDFGHKTKNKGAKRKGAYQGHDRTDKIYQLSADNIELKAKENLLNGELVKLNTKLMRVEGLIRSRGKHAHLDDDTFAVRLA